MFCWTTHLKVEDRSFYGDAAVAVRHHIYSFGGSSDADQMDVHILNTVSMRWRTLPQAVATTGTGQRPVEVPSSRRGHTAVLIGDIVYIWGGYPGNYCDCDASDELHAFEVDTHRWFKPQVSGAVPKMMCYHSACASGKVMYIHRYDKTHGLDTATMVWSFIKTTVKTCSYGHSATTIGTKMFVFGGRGMGGGAVGNGANVRVFDTEASSWLSVSSERSCLDIVDNSAFAYNGEVYVIDDWDLGCLQRFNPETFSWTKVETKGRVPNKPGGPRSTFLRMERMLCYKVGDRVVLFGGGAADYLYISDLSPSVKSLKALCQLAVIRHDLEKSALPHNIRWELAAMFGKEQQKNVVRQHTLPDIHGRCLLRVHQSGC